MMANANIYENMLNTQKKVEVLLETTRSLGSILDIDVLVKMIMQSAKDLLSADRCTLFLNDNEQKQLLALIQGEIHYRRFVFLGMQELRGCVYERA
ncbi:hypothetical protein BASA82_000928 [Batrachochytrium salamandrivorans]|nr:hypothetical protein BASA82_000928 [Batrachochytrium salamandrivorans]